MDAAIPAATWLLLIIPLCGVVLLSLLGLFIKPGAAHKAAEDGEGAQ